MTRVLVTGGAGFIGSHLVDYLLDPLGFEVTVLDDLSGGFASNVSPHATLITHSIVDHTLVNALFQDRHFDYVYHLAAYAAEGLSHFIKRFNYTNNLIGSVNLINASVNTGVRRFVFTSSIAVYGHNQLPMREDQTPLPEDSYGIAKLAVESELKASYELFGLEYVIFRPHNVYGERQNIGDRYRNVIGIFMNSLLQGRELVIFGDGEQQRAFTYIGDIIPALASAAVLPGARNEIFNVGADKPYTVNELAAIVSKAFASPPRVRHVAERKEVKLAYSDHSKMARVFPDLPHTELEEGIACMARWAKQVGTRSSQEFGQIEIRKNLPSVWVEPTAPVSGVVLGD